MKRTDITALFPEATDEQIKTLIDLNGADINTAKKGMEDLQTDLAKARGRIKELEAVDNTQDLKDARELAGRLQTELDGLKAANALRDMRASVAKEVGVPADLLTADTEDACKAQAQGILGFAKSQGYPAVKDGGELSTTTNLSAVDAAWASVLADINT